MGLDDSRSIDRGTDREILSARLARLTQALDSALSTLARHATPNAVHDARIAARRLLVALRNLRPRLPSRERRRCTIVLLEIAKACGAARNADVRRKLVQTFLARAGLERHEQGRLLLAAAVHDREAAGRELRERMNEPKWDKLLWDMRQNAASVVAGVRGHSRDGIIRDVLMAQRRRLRGRMRKCTRSRRHRQLHRLRLRIKDARYFAEDFGPLIRAPMEFELRSLRNLQKALGDLHDEWRLKKWLSKQYRCYLVAGALRELLKIRQRKLLKEIRQQAKQLRAAPMRRPGGRSPGMGDNAHRPSPIVVRVR